MTKVSIFVEFRGTVVVEMSEKDAGKILAKVSPEVQDDDWMPESDLPAAVVASLRSVESLSGLDLDVTDAERVPETVNPLDHLNGTD